MSTSRADDVYRFTEESIAADHRAHVDAVAQPTDRPAPPSEPKVGTPSSSSRPAWATKGR